MKDPVFSKPCYCLLIILTLLCFSSSKAQSKKSNLTQIVELKSNQNFSPQNPKYIDLMIELAVDNIHSNPDSTVILLKEAYQLSLASNYRIGESKILSTYGYYYSAKGEMDKALEYNKNALEVANKYKLNEAKVKALNNMGLDYWYQENHASALTQFLEALSVVKDGDDIKMITVLNNNIALLYHSNKDYDTALEFYEVSKKYSLDNNNEKLQASIVLNIVGVYIAQERFVEADRDIDKSIEIFEKFDSTEWLINAYLIKGDIAIGKDNYQIALEWLNKAEKLCNELDYGTGYTSVYKSLATVYLKLKDFNTAETYALKGLKISKELNITETVNKFHFILSDVYHEKGDYKKAYEYLNDYQLLYEKSAKEKFKSGLSVALSKKKFENQKELLIDEQNKAIAKQKNYVYLAIAALIVVLLFLLMIFRANRLQKKYTRELQEKQNALILHDAELVESNKTKDRLFSIIAHDLRGPIGSFHSLMELYLDNSLSKEESNYILPKALQEIKGISRMLNNLLIWAKTQMTGIEVKKQNIDIQKTVEDTVLLLTPFADGKNIFIKNSIPKNIISYSDKNNINIVMRNLISNAIKFTNNNGEILIKLIEKDDKLQIEVRDNGVGMDLETLDKLFKKNNTDSTYGTNNEKGTGLGLSLSKEMVESNGGKLWVTSFPDQGSSIYFTIPIKSDLK